MVREANTKQAASEKQLREARGKVSPALPQRAMSPLHILKSWEEGQPCLLALPQKST